MGFNHAKHQILFTQNNRLLGSSDSEQLTKRMVVRPPVRSNGRTYKILVMFLFFRRQISELPQPIAAKLCHMIETGVSFIN